MSSKEQAVEAVKTLLKYIGEDPRREGLQDTPERFVRAWDSWFSGYSIDPADQLRTTFEDSGAYDGIVLLKDIPIESYCEHHIAPIIGKVHVAYLPANKVVGLSKLARVAKAFSKRLVIQEKLTAQIAECIQTTLEPRGVAVRIEAVHQCMTTRGVYTPGTTMVTSTLLGVFRDSPEARNEVLQLFSDKD